MRSELCPPYSLNSVTSKTDLQLPASCLLNFSHSFLNMVKVERELHVEPLMPRNTQKHFWLSLGSLYFDCCIRVGKKKIKSPWYTENQNFSGEALIYIKSCIKKVPFIFFAKPFISLTNSCHDIKKDNRINSMQILIK